MKTVPLPSVFARYAGQVSFVIQRGTNEFSSSCPNCGGVPHDGEPPDRCRWFTSGNPPKPRGWCRHCGGLFWPDDKGSLGMSAVELEAWRLQRVASEQRRHAEAEKALDNLRKEQVWLEYMALMDEAARVWWEKRGVPRDWQEHLQLGYVPRRPFKAGGELLHAPAYSIPYFHADFEFITLQYRLNTTTTTDRYRFEQGTQAAYYMAEPNTPIGERVIICEGATKAMVTHIRGATGHTVLAVPSKSAWGGVVEAVAGAEQVIVMLDPDAGDQARKLARAIGPKARVASVPVKVDDAIVQHQATPADLRAYLRTAV